MEAQERGGLQDDRGTDQPARAHEERTRASNNAISQTEVGATFPGPIEDQQRLLDEQGLGHHRARAAGTGEPGDCRHEMEKQDGQIAHGASVTSLRNPRNAQGSAIRHAQAWRQPLTSFTTNRPGGLVIYKQSVLIATQCHRRIDAGRTARWYQTRSERDQSQDRRNCGEGSCIHRSDTIQNTSQYACQPRRTGNTNR